MFDFNLEPYTTNNIYIYIYTLREIFFYSK